MRISGSKFNSVVNNDGSGSVAPESNANSNEKRSHNSLHDSFCCNSTSLIDQYPEEIICQIAEYACASVSAFTPLSQVNRRWRHVIINNARLWTYINFSWNIDRIKTVYQRSKQAKLQLYIPNRRYNAPKEPMIYSMLESDCERIKKLDLPLLVISERLPVVSFPSLQYLVISGARNQGNLQKITTIVGSIRNLETLDLSAFDPTNHWDTFLILLTQVRQLSVLIRRTETYQNFLSVLPTLDRLRRLYIIGKLSSDIDNMPTSMSNNNLESLHVTLSIFTSRLLQRYQLPRLLHFRLDLTDRFHLDEEDVNFFPEGFPYTLLRYFRFTSGRPEHKYGIIGSLENKPPMDHHHITPKRGSFSIFPKSDNIVSPYYHCEFPMNTQYLWCFVPILLSKFSNLQVYELCLDNCSWHNDFYDIPMERILWTNSIRELIVKPPLDPRRLGLVRNVIDALANDRNLCPRLESLHLQFLCAPSFYPKFGFQVSNLLSERNKNGNAIKFLYIHTDISFDERIPALGGVSPSTQITHTYLNQV